MWTLTFLCTSVDKNDEPGSSAPPAKKQKTLSQPTYTDHDEPTGNAPPAKKPKTSSQSTDSDYDGKVNVLFWWYTVKSVTIIIVQSLYSLPNIYNWH